MKKLILILALMFVSCYPDDYVPQDVCDCGTIVESDIQPIGNTYDIDYVIQNNCTNVLDTVHIVIPKYSSGPQSGYPHMNDNKYLYQVGRKLCN